jgi:signal transduction histidine kinase
MPEFAAPEPEDKDEDSDEVSFFEMLLPDRTSLRKSPSLAEHTLPWSTGAPPEPDEPILWNSRLPNGRPGRLLQVEFTPELEDADEEEEPPEIPGEDVDHVLLPDHANLDKLRVVLIVGRSREDLNETLALMYASLAVLVVVVLGGIAIVLRRALASGFQPVDDLNAQLKAIGPDSLQDRIGLEAPRQELATVESAVNQLLGRLSAGFERERRFSSNVAHELRTPVSELRSACEVGGRWPDDPKEVRALFEDIHAVGVHMEKIVEMLLTLARCENGAMPVECERVELAPLLRACWQRVEDEAAYKGITVDLKTTGGLFTISDPSKLQVILQNLVDNAVGHGAPNSVIRCSATQSGSSPVIRIANQPEELDREDLPYLFERCWQKNAARPDRQRAGLGLSIARALGDLLGIRIEPKLEDDGTFVVQLILTGVET